jgi:hypothetical protein
MHTSSFALLLQLTICGDDVDGEYDDWKFVGLKKFPLPKSDEMTEF